MSMISRYREKIQPMSDEEYERVLQSILESICVKERIKANRRRCHKARIRRKNDLSE
jgi:hypothetical protein